MHEEDRSHTMNYKTTYDCDWDGEVRGAKLNLITKGKAIFVNRALQKLYPLEVCTVTTECENQTNELNTNPVGNEGSHLRVGKSHNRQLSWIRVGKHKPCSITNCLFFGDCCNWIVLDLGRSRVSVSDNNCFPSILYHAMFILLMFYSL